MDLLKAALPQCVIEDIANYLNVDELSNFASTSDYYLSLCAGVTTHRDAVSSEAGVHDHSQLNLISHDTPHRLGSTHLRNLHQSQETIHELTEQFRSSFNLAEVGGKMFPVNAAPLGQDTSVASSPTTEAFDSLNSTDTELTTPEEDEWEFTITPDLMRRLSKLPQHTAGATLPTLSNLPTELHLEIFSYLDKIDACCLGLSSSRSYSIFRSIFGCKMPLTTRRQGPNTLERAWEVVGKQECKHCGIYRCELLQHIKSWMPEDLEYCAFKNMFGARAEEGSRQTCYRAKPSKPRRCGRHPLRTTSVHQDDGLAMQKVY